MHCRDASLHAHCMHTRAHVHLSVWESLNGLFVHLNLGGDGLVAVMVYAVVLMVVVVVVIVVERLWWWLQWLMKFQGSGNG